MEQNQARESFDVVIIGAGPAGASAALMLSGKGKKVALLDKGVFPRDKICGDALSPDVVQQLGWIAPELAERFSAAAFKQEIVGLRVYSMSHEMAGLEFWVKKEQKGYVVARLDLDMLMMEEVKSRKDIQVFEGEEVREVIRRHDSVIVRSANREFSCKLIIGADGNHSIVAKQLAGRNGIDRRHHCGALRQYYQGVTWPDGDKHIELFYIKDLLPGYLWVFPMSGGRANVGVGMLSEDISRRKVNLKEVMERNLKENPRLKERFSGATPLEQAKGFGIPIGSKKYSLSGERYLLCGDAARLVDPLTGEGIANAIRSGRYAGQYALEALEKEVFSAESLGAYDRKIYGLIGAELRLSRFIQLSFRRPWVLRISIRLASRSRAYKRMIHLLFEETSFFTNWSRPAFYFGLLKRKS